MVTEGTSRHGLPLLVPGQGQKDVTHNEALEMLDILLHPCLESRSVGEPPAAPPIGRAWLVTMDATGAWTGMGGRVAAWTSGGWRFAEPLNGMSAWLVDEGRRIRRSDTAWVAEAPIDAPAAAIAPPIGGTVVDIQARAAISVILDRLQRLGLIT